MSRKKPNFNDFINLFDGLNYYVDENIFNTNTKIQITCNMGHVYFTSITKIKSLNHDYKNCPHCKKIKKYNEKQISFNELENIFLNTTFEIVNKKEYYSKWTDEIILQCKKDKNIEKIKSLDHWISNGKRIPPCSECLKIKVLSDDKYINELERIRKISFFDIDIPDPKYNSIITPNAIEFLSKANWAVKEYNGTRKKSSFICRICGFEKTANIYSLRNCLKCEKNKLKNGVKNKLYDICKASNIFILQDEIYKNVNSPIKFKCNNCSHEFENSWANITGKYYNLHCPECFSSTKRKTQKEICNYIKSIYNDEVLPDERTIIKPKEIDIYLPGKSLAFEYCGNIWHSEKFGKDKMYHYEKMIDCLKKQIQLITIFEDEWKLKNDICKSRISSLMGIYKNKIFARKCNICYVDDNKAKDFLNSNHLQGYSPADIHIGLVYENKLVSLMSFKNTKESSKPHDWELVRFANLLDHHITGGASKLLTEFKNNNKGIVLATFSDSRWSNGAFYEKIGFSFEYEIEPSYYYVGNHTNWRIKHRFTYNKKRLIELFKITDTNKSEHEIALENGLYRIYDCGHKKYTMHI